MYPALLASKFSLGGHRRALVAHRGLDMTELVIAHSLLGILAYGAMLYYFGRKIAKEGKVVNNRS